MRIIHTSDWHLGQHFMGKTRQSEHKAFLDWLADEIKSRKADGLVVAGDIFDTGTPPSYARTLYNEFIVSLQAAGGVQTLILGGNHDAPATLNEARSILACLNTRVVGSLSREPKDHLMVLNDKKGSPGLIVCALPFLRPGDLVKSLGGQSARDKQDAMGQAIQACYARVFEAARAEQKRLGPGPGNAVLPIMATGHLTVVGGKSSESVRDIYIGSLDAFAAKNFPGVDYLALGHLHRPQQIKDQDHIRYSGSPIPLSFDEASIPKQVLEVVFDQGRLKQITPIPLPCFRSLISLKGSLEKIENEIKALGAGEKQGTLTSWLEVEVSTDIYLTDLQERIQAMIKAGFKDPGQMELLRVKRKKAGPGSADLPPKGEQLEELTPKEVFARRLAKEELGPDQEIMLNRLFDEILDQVKEGVK
ncbi:MAG: exonuclease subunit SbcD [Desulfobacter sp.]|nr:exonuclease subunit SbcD [Desulfobacter sp.]